MLPFERRLAFAGLALFVLGLFLGFALRAFPNPRAALSAHLNAVQSGTFLIVLGLLWPHLAVWKAAANPICHAIWLSFWVLEIGMILGALTPAGGEAVAAARNLKLAATGLQGLSAIAMVISVGVLLLTFKAAPQGSVAASEPSSVAGPP